MSVYYTMLCATKNCNVRHYTILYYIGYTIHTYTIREVVDSSVLFS